MVSPKGSRSGKFPAAQIGNLEAFLPSVDGLHTKRVKRLAEKAAPNRKLVDIEYSDPALSENRRRTRVLTDLQTHIDRLESAKSLSPGSRAALEKFKKLRNKVAAGIVPPPMKRSK